MESVWIIIKKLCNIAVEMHRDLIHKAAVVYAIILRIRD